ncbi:exonuclease SbcC [Paenibacillus sp. SORGH_AS306]|uniref:hypothetical protein n=1 Tax=unclassified Paenibacillus TaxID=185978 RepID=UPI002783C990|nr:MULTISPECIES: hypothetical protein [unclassified Paenibacillus]MDQ1233393.1 exonuclease SbcC [Paenibacillus sp. SORGH_AS_0306]MDR6110433.1 exonuclease SbcC [Paenibacillus sp. SORGH_AS_0338]
MYLSEVKIKNFRGYGENLNRTDRFFVFDELDSPLIIFHGFNGHGKTSFFEAIEWCLTDNVIRLEKFYKSEHGGAYSVHDLNKSHYLKFSSSKSSEQVQANREIVVEILFNNGDKITRNSFSNTLAVTDSTNYNSTLQLIKKGEQAKIVLNNEILQYLVPESNDIKNFTRAHILSQEGITDFIRKTSPEDRKSFFMRYLQQEEISNHINELGVYLRSGSIFNKKKNDYNTNIVEIGRKKGNVNKYLQDVGYNDFESYIDEFKKLYSKLIPFVKRQERFPNIPLKLINLSLESENKDYTTVFRGASKIYEIAIREKDNLEEKIRNFNIGSSNIKLINLLKDAENWLKKSTYVWELKNNGIIGLQDRQNKNQEKSNNNLLRIKDNSEKLNILSDNQFIFSLLIHSINKEKKEVSQEIWNNMDNDFMKLDKFIDSFKEIIEQEQLIFPIKDIIKIETLKKRYNELDEKRLNILLRQKENTSFINEFSTLNKNYQEILNQVKSYIQQEEQSITSCPICLNTDFSYSSFNDSESNNTALILISIINDTMAKGNNDIERLLKQRSLLDDELTEIVHLINIEVIENLETFLELLTKDFLLNFGKIKVSLDQLQQVDNLQKNELRQESEFISRKWDTLRKGCKILFGEEIELRDVNLNELDEILLTKQKWFDANIKQLEFEEEPSLDEVINKIKIIKNIDLIAEYYPDNLEKFNKDFLYIKRNSLLIKCMIRNLENLVNIKLPSEYDDILSQYEQLDANLLSIESKLEVISNKEILIRGKYNELKQKQTNILGEQLQGHPIITWIYESINPHTQYKDLKVVVDNKGTHYASKDLKENLYLDQIFSQAQLNILALSTFLGIGLTQKYSIFNQLLLDDPIQSMDDLNTLAFIDVLRAILDSESNKKRLIISTHDSNFAELLSIKMRNKNIKNYFIEGYGSEGPIINTNL